MIDVCAIYNHFKGASSRVGPLCTARPVYNWLKWNGRLNAGVFVSPRLLVNLILSMSFFKYYAFVFSVVD